MNGIVTFLNNGERTPMCPISYDMYIPASMDCKILLAGGKGDWHFPMFMKYLFFINYVINR